MSEAPKQAEDPLSGPVTPDEFARLMTACADKKIKSGSDTGVAVAVSGGADSMALALLAHGWGQKKGIPVTALTVDHGLRFGSDTEAEQVGAWLNARFCDSQTFPHHVLAWRHDDVRSAVQARARVARYRLMGDWCRGHGVTRLLAAHHLGDQAETVLLRLKKGSTLFGLAAMAAQTPLLDCPGVTLCRPFLSLPKARLIATLQDHGQTWVDDPSNQNSDFERVRVRAQLVQLADEGVTAERLAGAARGARAVRDILDKAAHRLMDTCVVSDGGGPAVTVLPEFGAAPEVVRGRALAHVLTRMGGRAYAPSPAKLDRLLRWMDQKTPSGGRTLAGCWVRLGGGGFLISPEPPRNFALESKKSGTPEAKL